MMNKNTNIDTLDLTFDENERLPESFIVNFKEINEGNVARVLVKINGRQVGDIIDDNSYEKDNYRYHDVFHYTFATMLNWSPCTRAMLGKKRKSVPLIDHYEDGARATITEEAISLILFNQAKKNNNFRNGKVSKYILKQIKQMTQPFEVRIKNEKEWEVAILKGYALFSQLVENKGGKIKFNRKDKSAIYIS